MLPLPESDWSNPEVLASWMELTVLAEDDGVALRGDALEALRDSQLFADASITRGDERDSSTEDSAASALHETWQVLRRREELLEDAWPLRLTDNTLSRAPGKTTLRPVAAYATILLLEAASSKWYSSIAIEPGDPVREWFEHITVASVGRLIGGRTERFGAPFPRGWPNSFSGRVKQLAGLFGVEAREADVKRLATPDQQDDALDAVARSRLGDEEPGTPYLLVQCATGANWKTDKSGEPRMALWRKYIAWNGPTYKAIAIPFCLRGKGELERASASHGDAVVFDRLRISAGAPDQEIDDVIRKKLVKWCSAKFAKLTAPSRPA